MFPIWKLVGKQKSKNEEEKLMTYILDPTTRTVEAVTAPLGTVQSPIAKMAAEIQEANREN